VAFITLNNTALRLHCFTKNQILPSVVVFFLTLMIPTLGCIGLPKIKSSPVWWCGFFFTHNNTTLRLHWVTLGCGNYFDCAQLLYSRHLTTDQSHYYSRPPCDKLSTSLMSAIMTSHSNSASYNTTCSPLLQLSPGLSLHPSQLWVLLRMLP